MKELKRIILAFCISYMALVLISTILYKLDYPPIEYLIFSILFYIFFNASAYCGALSKNSFYISRHTKSQEKIIEEIMRFSYIITLVSVGISWLIILNHYGGLAFVVINANYIRNSTIGQSESILPTSLSYACSLIYAVWVYELAVWRDIGRPRYSKLVPAFIIIFLVDLMSFGRVGLFFALITAFSFFVAEKKLINRKTLLLIVLIFFMAMLPRLVRGDFDNFEGTVNEYKSYFRFETPEAFNMLMSIIPYFTGSFISGPKMMSLNEFGDVFWGEKTFTPIFNLIYKFVEIDRVSSIDEFVSIPYEHNVHGLVWDFYRDFGLYGSIFAVIIFGFLLGRIPNIARGRLSNAAAYFVGGILFYAPIYSLFSVGGFFIAFSFILLLIIFSEFIH